MSAAGIDVAGTKIEAKNFAALRHSVDKLRFISPRTFGELVEVVCQAVEWADTDVSNLPIGVGAAGLIACDTGHAIIAGLPTFGNRCQRILLKQQGVMRPTSMIAAPLRCLEQSLEVRKDISVLPD